MSIEIIESRIQSYKPNNKQEELNALKEVCQEIALLTLSRSNFFKQGAFQGGTCLRIVYGLPRFSEDLDFILYEDEPDFNWRKFSNDLSTMFASFGLSIDFSERDAHTTVKKAFLKSDSFGKVLQLSYPRNASDPQTLRIKLEIDTHPPTGSTFTQHVLDYPAPFTITTQDMPSLFAGKVHALLCRPYTKGRDWYDFIWYVNQHIQPNYAFLESALDQEGPWKKSAPTVDQTWLIDTLQETVQGIDWKAARQDVENFIKPFEKDSLSLWGADFFSRLIEKWSTQ